MKKGNIVAIIQARMGSTRLPGKVLKDLDGEPVLARVVNRTQRTSLIDEVVIATTINPGDEAILSLCSSRSWSYFRGSENDVLDRYYRAANEYKVDVIVRITSDCPIIDPEIVNQVVQEFLDRQPTANYACNMLPRRTFPRGLEVEVLSFDTLGRAWREDRNSAWREHVTPYIYRNPNRFSIHGIMNEVDYSHMRWTIDTHEDLAFIRKIYEYFGHDRFSWNEVLTVLEEHPEWIEINRHIKQKVINGK